MAAKAVLRPNHIPINSFQLIVAGVLPTGFTITKMGGLEEELDTVDLPDRTRATGGRTGAIEFDVETPAHHLAEQIAWEAWFQEARDPVSPIYKKVGTLQMPTMSGNLGRSFTLTGLFVKKRATPDGDMDNNGDMAVIKWTLSCDDMVPL